MTRKGCHDAQSRPDKSMNKYELLYIVGTHYTDPEVEGIQAKVTALLTKNEATILRNENVGKIRLAYAIKKIRNGSYILVHFDALPTIMKELNRQLGLMEEVLRHTLIARAPGAENKKVEIFAYVAPLSEEAKRMETKPAAAPHREKQVNVDEIQMHPPVAVVEPSMSIEELDKKLEQILESDMSEEA